MAYENDSVWAVDLGNSSLKALHLTVVNGVIQALGFDTIRHSKILAGSGIGADERNEIIALSLRKFAEQNDVYDSEVIISVPSQNSFARFVTLPPVDKKKIPEIVRFEAVQQIPFDISEVQWAYQMMSGDDEPERKVGIFAIKNEVVDAAIEPFENEDIGVSFVQMAPMALYNYIIHDRPDLTSSDAKAIVILNVGAENTDLVVCTQTTVWQRCILIGGNAFTRAIADTFKLNFQKAEKLKRTAPVSKYARQIFQAMRPVFTDLASEVQRSLGFYASSNPHTKLTRVIGLGGGARLRGLMKYMQQTLQIPVQRPDSFKRLAMGPGVSAAKFTENVADLGVVYGLGVQALGYGQINSNLLPQSIARSIAWAGKARWLTIAASVLLIVSVAALGRTIFDGILYRGGKPGRGDVIKTLEKLTDASQSLSTEEARGTESQAKIDKYFEPFMYRDIIPTVQETLLSVLPNEKNNPAQAALYKAFAAGDAAAVMSVPRMDRKQVFLTTMSIYYAANLEAAQYGATATQRQGSTGMTGGGTDEDYLYEEEMMEMEMAMSSGGQYAPGFGGATGQAADEINSGFVISVAGYSPYGRIHELLHPDNVENTPEKWGMITRLLHLDDTVVDGNSPFEVLSVTDPAQFKVETGAVDLDASMPIGVGVVDERVGKTTASGTQTYKMVLDPMTREIISKTSAVDAAGAPLVDRRTGSVIVEENDHWFVMNIKLIWRDAPKDESAAAGGFNQGGGYGR